MTRLARLSDRLELKEFQLRSLLEVTRAITANAERTELLDLYNDIVRNELGITRLMLFEHATSWDCILSYGVSARDQAIDVEHELGSFSDIQLIGSTSKGRLEGFDIAVPVYNEGRALAFLLIGDIDEEERKMSPSVKHLNFIQTLTNVIVSALENKRLAVQALHQERDKRELELAAEMQSMLVPARLPDTERFRAAAWYLPHRQVGGDYYDVVELSKDMYMLAIADVSGKGMAAALLMSNFQATLRALSHYSRDPLDALVHDLNDKVYGSARGERFITLFIGFLNITTGEMRYVNAGHNPPLLYHDGTIEELSTGSIALGMMAKLPFLQHGVTVMRPTSTLLCYTDGLVEQEDGHEIELGMEPLRKALSDLHSSGPEAVNSAVIANFEAHRAGQPYLDDIALLTCQLR